MATNKKYSGTTRAWPVSASSGDPIVRGEIPAVATGDTDADTGLAPVDMEGVYNLTVEAIDGGGNSAVADGDVIYYNAGDTPKLNKKDTGVRFGTAYGTLAAGATGTVAIEVGR
jgi:hypothetical protein